ncbi:TRAP transporter substrate-binding protein [Halomonas organivorans]|uniref:TRAP-type C4-dicarboxylate transport system substrate-binding protein n=1 Tax=Halomonas organivorans TaxID=257772 RepID=A0A7W5BYC7_9GAMM|nr:TRAP transporter substrate-binding protein [Halomonas organivorans]MBB3141430.1 TRAP-type C4-dicarboxylate transport system substrate-binding protein [Halomonas organivorans]
MASPMALASDTVTLRIMHFLPAVSNAQQNVIEPWCNDLENRSEGHIECQIYPSMQLGGNPAQLADMVRNGVIDIAWTALGYSAGRFPRSEALELPFMLPGGGVEGSDIAWDFYQQYAQEDFEDYKVLALQSDGGGSIHTADTAVHDMDDMEGLRLRASTRMAASLIDSLGGTPVSMPPAQIADTLAKGVIDGAMAVWEVVPPTKLDEVTHYHSQTAENQATPTVTTLAMLMNKRSYEGMPEDLRKILNELSGRALSVRFGESWDRAIDSVRSDISADPDHTVITLSDEEYVAMRDASRPIIEDWAASNAGGIDRQVLVEGLQQIVEQKAPNLQ